MSASAHPLDHAQEGLATVLLREAEHRFGNMLTISVAELRCELGEMRDPTTLGVLERLENKIYGLGQLYHALSANTVASSATTQTYFDELLNMLATSFLVPINVRCQATISDGVLSTQQCEYLARILTELVINASKHAFRSSKSGLVEVSLNLCGGKWVCLVRDDGQGFVRAHPGAGSHILSSLVGALNGKLSVQSSPTGTGSRRISCATAPPQNQEMFMKRNK